MTDFDWNLLLSVDWPEIGAATLDTLTMLGVSLLATVALGLPLGVLLYVTAPGQLRARPRLYAVLSFLVNVLRSLPFVILLIVLIPLTLLLVGTSIGVAGAIVPLVVGAVPFFGRLVENVLREVDRGVIEASQAMGARLPQIVLKVLLPEALPGLIGAATVTAVALVGYTAMSGVIGGGGLGDLAVRYGYQRFQTEVMVVTVALLLVLVQLLQSAGDRLVRRCRFD
ncbi:MULTISPECIES: methionine ABC transporter permease [Vogesella]|jgi:D-methionine transport system permease protein|uniref:ABC transporter permease n=1 Tax=Vogesella indigofera TaxID=45465 RepID=A0ABT5I352_VOGIN|nr:MULTISPECIES: methionine ABC transporter permease [Vogesella]KMJ53049.1 metal ABC transporter permease [Vogesella sp. EB]MCQ4142960.1 ABC transporter permease [Vogesella sp. AC12]MDC7690548.1 ABC transporter permease [Vogesella indigofera]MDC7698249.1 ABC transporter permease [Vogesella indigofera]